MKFIILHEQESGKPHLLNVNLIERYTDYVVWMGGKRFKVKESASEILTIIIETEWIR